MDVFGAVDMCMCSDTISIWCGCSFCQLNSTIAALSVTRTDLMMKAYVLGCSPTHARASNPAHPTHKKVRCQALHFIK
eukprot:1513808-Amphidinium_carterae.1